VGRLRTRNKKLPQRMYLQHGSYYYVDYKGKWNNLGRSYSDALRNLAVLVGDARSLNTMNGVFDRYALDVIPTKAPRTQLDYRKQLPLLRAVFGEVPPHEITATHVFEYRNTRGKQSVVQANREKSLLSAIFTNAIEWGVVTQNPCKQVPRLHEQKRERYVAEAEFQNVRDLATPMMQIAMDLALLTGLRQGDLLRLEKRHLTNEGIDIVTAKTKKRLIIEWSADLRAVIDRAFEISPRVRQFVICNLQGKPYTSDGFRTMWDRLMRKSFDTKVIAERFTFHDIRAKSLSDDSASAATIRSGHSDPKVTNTIYRRKPTRARPLDRTKPQEY
jgi:integrase